MERVIIDTDTAGDDTIALLTALHFLKVEGVTITGGNVAFQQQIENALYTIQVANVDFLPPYIRDMKDHYFPIGINSMSRWKMCMAVMAWATLF